MRAQGRAATKPGGRSVLSPGGLRPEAQEKEGASGSRGRDSRTKVCLAGTRTRRWGPEGNGAIVGACVRVGSSALATDASCFPLLIRAPPPPPHLEMMEIDEQNSEDEATIGFRDGEASKAIGRLEAEIKVPDSRCRRRRRQMGGPFGLGYWGLCCYWRRRGRLKYGCGCWRRRKGGGEGC